jgi:GxxExxY protein
LGPDFLEKVYERALLRELGLRGLQSTSQVSFSVAYKGQSVGGYFADILVEDVLVVELKCVDRLTNDHLAQCLNYIRASGMSLCLLINLDSATDEFWQQTVDRLRSSGKTILVGALVPVPSSPAGSPGRCPMTNRLPSSSIP